MNWFKKKPVEVSAPTVTHVTIFGNRVDVTGQEAQFPGTSIWVKKGPVAYPNGNYLAKVLGHLAEIRQRPIGIPFFTAITAANKRQNIIYGGANSNQCAGSAMGYVMLRKLAKGETQAQFATELRATLARSGKGKPWVAARLSSQNLPHWNGVSTPGPLTVAGGAVLLQGAAGGAALQKFNSWCDGSALPSLDELDVLLLVLEPWLQAGPGVGSRINYDPDKVMAGGQARPPHAALFHELTHAYYNAIGMQLGVEESSSEVNGGRLFELMSTGLPPFDTKPYGENQFRAEWPCTPRLVYP